MERRDFLKLALSGAALPLAARRALALDYPNRPVHMLVGQAAGSSSDIAARLIAQYLSDHLGQQFVVDIRPGATGNVATEAVVHSAADGYTILLVNSQNTINQAMFPDLPFDFMHDIAPIAIIDRVALVMEVLPTFPAQTVPEFIAYAKANPGKINFASGGVGTAPHLAGELFKQMAGVNMVHVPYTSSYMPDLLAGRVQVTFAPIATSIANIKAGKLRALAVTGPTRSDVLPNIPAVSEFVPGYEASVWHGVGAPNGTASDIINKLNQQINAVIADPGVKAQLNGLGAVPMPMTPGEFGKFVAAEVKKWANVVKLAGLKPE